MCRALARRASEGDGSAIEALADVGCAADRALHEAVTGYRAFQPAHNAPRYSWTDVGNLLGITRQSAQERFGK
jgi:hypothetical protein